MRPRLRLLPHRRSRPPPERRRRLRRPAKGRGPSGRPSRSHSPSPQRSPRKRGEAADAWRDHRSRARLLSKGDAWPEILKQILAADILIFASPIWWNNQSSEIQRVIERLDELHDEILAGKRSKLEGKAGGIIITGDSDGAQHIIANVSNFYNAIGINFPPYATLSVLWEKQAKGENTSRQELMEKYKKDYDKTAETMVNQLIRAVKTNP